MNQSEIIQPTKSISQMLEKTIYLKINSPNEEFIVFSLIPKEGQSIPLPTPKKGTQVFSFSSTKYGNVVIYLEKTLHFLRYSFFTKCTLKKTKLSISANELLSSTIYISDSFLTS